MQPPLPVPQHIPAARLPSSAGRPIPHHISLASEVDDLTSRTPLYRGTYLLQEALYGAEHDDPDALNAGLAPYL